MVASDHRVRKLIAKTAAMAILVIIMVPIMLFVSPEVWVVFCVILGIGLVTEFSICYINNRSKRQWRFMQYISAFVLLVLVFTAIGYTISIREMPFGVIYLVFITLGIVTNDGIAEVIGAHFGTPGTFFVKASPNKSWQGAAAGLVSGIVIVIIAIIIAARCFGWSSELLQKLCIIFVGVPILATAGDLLESYVKRSLGVKDFSKVLGPEIGGLLDRFDSWLLTVTVIGILLSLLM